MIHLKAHPLDAMTPIERARAIREGRPYDRIPIVPFLGEISGRLIGCSSVREYRSSPSLIVRGEIAAFNRYGMDGISGGMNSIGMAEALGADFVYPEHGIPYTASCVITEESQVRVLEPVDPGKTIQFLDAKEVLERLLEEAEGIVGVGAGLGGPFTICSFLMGTDQLLKNCVKKKDMVHGMMRIVTDSMRNCIDELSVLGVGFGFADPVASGSLISPKIYEEFVFPYMQELCSYIYTKTGVSPSLHMCGNTVKLWKYIRQLQIGSLSIDNLIDLENAKEELGSQFAIVGNVPPIDVIMLGSREEIFESVKKCVEAGKDTPKGYTIAPGCNIPLETQLQKIDWFVEAGRMYGRMDN